MRLASIFFVVLGLIQGCKSASSSQNSEVASTPTHKGLSFKPEYVMHDSEQNPKVMVIVYQLSDDQGQLTDELAVAVGRLKSHTGATAGNKAPSAEWTACIAKPGPLAYDGGFVTTGITLFMTAKPECSMKLLYTGDVGEGGQKPNYLDKNGGRHQLFGLDQRISRMVQDTTGDIEKAVRAAVHAYKPGVF